MTVTAQTFLTRTETENPGEMNTHAQVKDGIASDGRRRNSSRLLASCPQ